MAENKTDFLSTWKCVYFLHTLFQKRPYHFYGVVVAMVWCKDNNFQPEFCCCGVNYICSGFWKSSGRSICCFPVFVVNVVGFLSFTLEWYGALSKTIVEPCGIARSRVLKNYFLKTSAFISSCGSLLRRKLIINSFSFPSGVHRLPLTESSVKFSS